jgi:putative intracellular protease/amidase
VIVVASFTLGPWLTEQIRDFPRVILADAARRRTRFDYDHSLRRRREPKRRYSVCRGADKHPQQQERSEAMNKRVLIILTSHGELGDTGKPTGFHWEEMTTPYWRLRDAGYAVGFASPQGGEPPADPKSAAEDGRPESVQRFMDDAEAMQALKSSRKVAEVNSADYAAIYLPGGHGTMWDLAQTNAVGGLVARSYEEGAVIGAICHGPAGLVGATLSSGKPLVQGKRVNSFTDAEERKVGLDEVVPYLLESRLRSLGAEFEGNEEPFGPHVVRDGRLVTGQNPASAEKLAEELIAAIREVGGKQAA